MNHPAQDPRHAPVARALQMALHLPAAEYRRLRVQVVSRDGQMLAAGVLDSLEQVAFLKDQLQLVGAFDAVPTELAQQRGCDVLIRESYVSRSELAGGLLNRWVSA